MLKFYLLLLFCIFSLTACLSPIKNIEKQTYTFNPPPISTQQNLSPAAITLLVNPPTTSAAYNTNQMVYSKQLYQLNYFAKNYWVDTPAHMLQPLLAEKLQHSFHAVVTNASSQYDFILNTSLLQLQQEFIHKPSQVRLVAFAQLLQAKTNKVITSKQFNITVPAPQDTPYGGVVATNQAIALLLMQIDSFAKNGVR